MDERTNAPNQRSSLARRVFLLLPVALTALAVMLDIGIDLKTFPILQWLSNTPSWMIWVGAGILLAGTFLTGSMYTLAIGRGARQAVLNIEETERQLARTRQELVAVQQDVANRTTEYTEIGDRLREASAMLEITEDQTSGLRRSLFEASQKTKRVWWVAAMSFVTGVGLDYFVEWTANDLKPPFLHSLFK
jgi:hypothetical protein